MIRFYFHPTPNPAKVSLFLEETGLSYEIHPVDTRKGEQHDPAFLKINPNAKVPAIVDTEGPGGKEVRIFDSSAILLYLGDKTSRFIGTPAERGEMLSWLFFISSGLGPFSGQAVFFQHMAQEKPAYVVNRYRREAERHYQVLDDHLQGRDYFLDSGYSIVDMSAWGWIGRAPRVMATENDPLAPWPNLKRWFQSIETRPAVARAKALDTSRPFKTEMDDLARRAMYPSDYPKAG